MRETAFAQTNTVRMYGEDLERKKYGKWTGKVEIGKRKKFLAVGEACVAVFRPTPGF